MQDFPYTQRKALLFVIFILILGLGLSYLKKITPRRAERIIYLDNPDKKLNAQIIADTTQKLIPINTADQRLLCCVPGIGKVIAQRIINYRHQNGLFKTKEDLMLVKGIGQKKFQKMRDCIILNEQRHK
ncbi:MAG: hypothetical protein DRP78_01465 [Candidatus Omnitrophota bacterium]|nr:MAG: hypothetical protein DRP78_01465 [Candidatus Omnitrophota bacterium]